MVKRDRRNISAIRKAHKRLGWSSSVLNGQFRNALFASGKWVAATDVDLMIYTRHGPAFVLEQKNYKQSLEQDNYIDISKVQIDVLLDICDQLKPKPTLLLVVYDAHEVDKLKHKAKVYCRVIDDLFYKTWPVFDKPRKYRLTKSNFFVQSVAGLIEHVNKTISSPQWASMPTISRLLD